MFKKNLVWDKNKYQDYTKYLNNYKEDKKFIDFNKKLIFTKYEILGF